MVFLKEFFEKVDFEKKSVEDKKHEKLPSRQRIKEYIKIIFGTHQVELDLVFDIFSHDRQLKGLSILLVGLVCWGQGSKHQCDGITSK